MHHPRRCRAAALVPLLLLLAAGSTVLSAQNPFTPAIQEADVDFGRCRSYADGKAGAPEAEAVRQVLGLSTEDRAIWAAGQTRGDRQSASFHYLVAFKRPVRFGTVLCVGGIDEVRILKPGVEGEPDPAREADWTALEVRPCQSGGVSVTAPPETATRALLLTDNRKAGRSRLESCRILAARLVNVTNTACAYADSEYTRITDLAPPHTFAAADIPRGAGPWQNTGRDTKGKIHDPPVSDVHPTWFMLTWDAPQTVCGLWIRTNITRLDMHYYAGPEGVSPRAGTPREWRKLREWRESDLGRLGRFIRFDEPVRTRGLRLTGTAVGGREDQVATIEALHTFVDIGAGPVPPLPAMDAGREEPPPLAVAYELPWDGMVTVALDGPDGRRVRNLVTRAERTAGPQRDGWDLLDDAGRSVPPGKYTARIIAHPPLDLRYQFTVYPNVSQLIPENSPWLNGPHGPGGWMADHSAPSSIAVADRTVYLGSPCAESGVSLIETDLRGAKDWGYHTLHEGFGGPWFLATDNQSLFVAARATMLWSFDIATKQLTRVLDRAQTAARKDLITGMAARDGKVYLAQGAETWLTNAMSADDVDILECIPRQPPTRAPRFSHECVPDPQGDFLRLLRLRDTPPGHGQDLGLIWLESSAGRAPVQYVMVAFKRPVPIGSIVYPVPRGVKYEVRFSLLKPDAPFPPNPAVRENWTPFKGRGKAAWDVVAAPEGAMTRALLITFVREGADLFNVAEGAGQFDRDSLLKETTKLGDEPADDLGKVEGGEFQGRLEGLKILRRRYENVAPSAHVSVSSGQVGPDGVWDAKRDRAVSEEDPGIYALVWDQPQKLRGLAVKEIDGRTAKIDVYTGQEAKPDIRARDGWTTVATYRQPLRLYYFPNDLENQRARYLDGYIPFRNEITTRAVRIRIVEQYVRQEQHYPYGFRNDLGGLDWNAARCRIFGVAALSHIGGEPAVDPLIAQRVEELDGATGRTLREVPLANPGQIAFAPDGRLFGISDRQVVRIDFEGAKHEPLITDLAEPAALAFDPKGHAYVFDNAPDRRNIRVYDRSGKLVRTIGRAGGRVIPGPWDVETFVNVSGLGADREGKLWVVENNYWPKRVSVWTTEGQFVKEFLGPTAYGGGGALDPWNKKRFFYGPLEFELDWEHATSRIKQITSAGDALQAPQIPVKIGDRMYLCSHQGWDAHGAVGVVYLQQGETYRRVAAFGRADQFEPINSARSLDELKQRTLQGKIFIWTDRNGDQEVQSDEVALENKPDDYYGVGKFNRRLSSIGGRHQYVVKEFLPNGVPVYERRYCPQFDAQFLWQEDGGLFHRMHSYWRKEGSDAWIKPSGEAVATYPSEPNSGFALPRAGPYTPSQVVCQFKWVGDETAAGGDLGEFLVLNSNVAQWYLWSSDGLLAGRLFRDMRDPKAIPWSMKQHDRGMQVRDFNIGQEHFEGYFTETFEDGKFYAVAGHNHASLVEVRGLDQFKRWNREINVGLEDLVRTSEWMKTRHREAVVRRAPVIECRGTQRPPRIDGDPSDWDFVSASIGEDVRFSMSHDADNLYLLYQVDGLGPLQNTGEDWRRLFKTGGSADLQIGTDPKANPARRAPVSGDMRLLMTWVKGKPIAVLYEPVCPGAKPDEEYTVTSPVSSVKFDRVVKLPQVRMAVRARGAGYVLEAAVPLSALRLKPEDGTRLKMDWGILRTGPDGYEVLERIYWSNKATGIVADAPSEARMSPDMWGHVLFFDQRAAGAKPTVEDLGKKIGADKGDQHDAFLDELREQQ